MTDLTAFGLEPQDPPGDNEPPEDAGDGDDSVWSACVDCGYVGYEVRARFDHSVPLCPDCFAAREGIR